MKNVLRVILGAFMIYAGVGHLTFLSEEFQAQVPNWFPLSKDFLVLLSGALEISLGIVMIFWKNKRPQVGIALAVFYIIIFPGNIAQYLNKISAFGLDTDAKRFIRLLFQPVLIYWALWSTNAISYLKNRKTDVNK